VSRLVVVVPLLAGTKGQVEELPARYQVFGVVASCGRHTRIRASTVT
jgi:hypothetical protein